VLLRGFLWRDYRTGEGDDANNQGPHVSEGERGGAVPVKDCNTPTFVTLFKKSSVMQK
jgi:hypothetical protein